MQQSSQMKPLRKWPIRPLCIFAVGQNADTRTSPGRGSVGSTGDLREGHGSLLHQKVLPPCIVTSRHAKNAIQKYVGTKVPMMAIGCIGQQGEVVNSVYQSEWQHCLSDKVARAPYVVSTSGRTIGQKLTTSSPNHRVAEIHIAIYSFSMLTVIIRKRLNRNDNGGARDRC
jgi:hypothetical protein